MHQSYIKSPLPVKFIDKKCKQNIWKNSKIPKVPSSVTPCGWRGPIIQCQSWNNWVPILWYHNSSSVVSSHPYWSNQLPAPGWNVNSTSFPPPTCQNWLDLCDQFMFINNAYYLYRAGHFRYLWNFSITKNDFFEFFIKLITYFCTSPISKAPSQINLKKNAKNHFSLLKRLKYTESDQLWK